VIAGWAWSRWRFRGPACAGRSGPEPSAAPGSYRLSFALFNNGNNLTGGRLIEKWAAVPPLTLDVQPVSHPQDEWAGVLNVPATLTTSAAETPVPVQSEPRPAALA
jgi:hypothetical protein